MLVVLCKSRETRSDVLTAKQRTLDQQEPQRQIVSDVRIGPRGIAIKNNAQINITNLLQRSETCHPPRQVMSMTSTTVK